MNVCTHYKQYSGQKAIVEGCKRLSENECEKDTTKCVYNFDRAPSSKPGSCTHRDNLRKQKHIVDGCKTLNAEKCLKNPLCLYNIPDFVISQPSTDYNVCTHEKEYSRDLLTVQTCQKLSSKKECLQYKKCKWNSPIRTTSIDQIYKYAVLGALILLIILCICGIVCLVKYMRNKSEENS